MLSLDSVSGYDASLLLLRTKKTLSTKTNLFLGILEQGKLPGPINLSNAEKTFNLI